MALDIAAIEKNIQKLRKSLKHKEKNPSPDVVHKLRTRAKRFEAVADTLHSAVPYKPKRLLKHLKRVRTQAGKVRDADVLSALLSTVQIKDNQDDENRIQTLEYLGASRYRHAARLRKIILKYNFGLRKTLKRLSKSLDKLSKNQGDESRAGAQSDAAAHVLRLSQELHEPRKLNRGNLHDYRAKIKELQYALQNAKPPRTEKFLEALRQCKDAIGEWHDWEELIATTTKVLSGGNGSKLLAQLKAISAEKFDHALSVTEKLRRSELHAQGSRTAPGFAPQPVLRAVSSLSARAS